ncbi:MAG: hypothetical protein HY078_01090 [Elusimicrobia bacterium]|nr:hypothetical protein [Elusimicrobiota bacterium]
MSVKRQTMSLVRFRLVGSHSGPPSMTLPTLCGCCGMDADTRSDVRIRSLWPPGRWRARVRLPYCSVCVAHLETLGFRRRAVRAVAGLAGAAVFASTLWAFGADPKPTAAFGVALLVAGALTYAYANILLRLLPRAAALLPGRRLTRHSACTLPLELRISRPWLGGFSGKTVVLITSANPKFTLAFRMANAAAIESEQPLDAETVRLANGLWQVVSVAASASRVDSMAARPAASRKARQVSLEYQDDLPAWRIRVPNPEHFEGVRYTVECRLFKLPQGAVLASLLRLYDVPTQPYFVHRVLDLSDANVQKYIDLLAETGRCVLIFQSTGQRPGFDRTIEFEQEPSLSSLLSQGLGHNATRESLDGAAALEVYLSLFDKGVRDTKGDIPKVWHGIESRITPAES